MDHPFVLTHCFPIHHGCRSGWVTMRRSRAGLEGITQDPPVVEVTPGFGHPPNLTEPPKPSERENPPDPALQLENAVKAGKDLRKRKPVKIKIDRALTPEHWEAHYRDKYGDAARQVGYGRALHERAKQMSWTDAIASAKELLDAGVPGISNDTLRALMVAQRYGTANLANGVGEDAEAARLLVAHVALLKGKRAPFGLQQLAHLPSANRLAKAAKWYEHFCSVSVDVPDVYWTVHDDPKWRAFIHAKLRDAHLGTGEKVHTWVHEWGHAVEVADYSVVRKVVAFRAAREGSAVPRRLSEVTWNEGFDDDEVTREDRYWNPYAGKLESGDCSEVLSTLFGDIAEGKAGIIMSKDPESLYFGLGILAGY